jgi:site-specific recombinase XerD
MARAFKRHWSKTDPATGERIRGETKCWYAEYLDADGTIRRRRGYTDKTATEQLAARLEREAAQRAEGMLPDERLRDHLRRSLSEHLDDFEKYIAGQGATPDHAKQKVQRVRAMFDACAFECAKKIDAPAVVAWLDGERRADRLSLMSCNYYLRDAKSFCAWMVAHDRGLIVNPFRAVRKIAGAAEPTRERRTLTADETRRLLAAARAGGQRCGLSGPDREMLYLTALGTGFRVQELASLSPASLNLASEPPTVTVQGKASKRRRTDVQEIRRDLADRLRLWLADRPAGQRLWPGVWWKRSADMLRGDLGAARKAWIGEAGPDGDERKRREQSDFLTYRDDAGRVFDFHSFRHQFITGLVRSGANLKVVKELARHSKLELVDRYAHVRSHDKLAALDALPPLAGDAPDSPQEVRATGTDGAWRMPIAGQLSAKVRGSERRSVQLPAVWCSSGGPSADDVSSPEVLRLEVVRSDLQRDAAGCNEEAPPGFEPGVADLQSAALPLG